MKTLIRSKAFAEIEGFNSDPKKWDAKIAEINELQEKYGFDSGTKEIFYGLAQTGECVTWNEDRVREVRKVLIFEDYEFTLKFF